MPNNKEPLIYAVDDHAPLRETVAKILRAEGCRVEAFGTAGDCRAALEMEVPDVLVLDLMLPDTNGLDFLSEVHSRFPFVNVIMLTGNGTIEAAVDAVKRGAYDFLLKPVQRIPLVQRIQKALEHRRVVEHVEHLEQKVRQYNQVSNIVGSSPALLRALDIIERVAATDCTVLITGESGTGKEVIARALHDLSPRATGPFVGVNCAALTETLIESELFGHEKGAFTGAIDSRPGRFERAHQGTIFLDEIAEVPPSTQVKLLRVLQDRQVERVGGTRTSTLDVRVVAATNAELKQRVKDGSFREDLYYRLKVVEVALPPLRRRRSDIPPLAEHFLATFAKRHRKSARSIDQEAMRLLSQFDWPGNVRELQNVIERAVVLATGPALTVETLPEEIRNKTATTAMVEDGEMELAFNVGTPLDSIELQIIQKTLEHFEGNRRAAAESLGIAERTIYRKLKGMEESATPAAPETDSQA